jgi:hypothetical protein
MILNAGVEPITFALPQANWWCVFDTTATGAVPEAAPDEDTPLGEIGAYEVKSRSLVLLRRNGGT